MTDATKNWLADELLKEGVRVVQIWHLIAHAVNEDEQKLAIALHYLELISKPPKGKADSPSKRAKHGLAKIAAVPSGGLAALSGDTSAKEK